MLPLVDIITSSYLPFGDPATASTSRRVGIRLRHRGDATSGHVVTERQLTDDCQGIIVAGLGRADRLADDAASDLALLRVNGARNLKPLPFSAEPPKSTELTLVGISEPDAQAGARNVTTVPKPSCAASMARGCCSTCVPARGFVGGAALDGEGQLAGMIDIAPASSQAPRAQCGSGIVRSDRHDPQISGQRRVLLRLLAAAISPPQRTRWCG